MKPSVAIKTSPPRKTRPRAPAALAVCLALASLALLAGCPGKLEGDFPPVGGGGSGGSPGGVDCDAPSKVFQPTCGGLTCHSGTFPPKLLPVDETMVFTGKAIFDCIGQDFVDPSDPRAGVLAKRILGTECGERMPMGKPALSDGDIQCVLDWLTAHQP